LKRFSLVVLLLSSTPTYAEDGLTLSGSSRIRYETIDGQPRTGFNEADDLLNIRTIFTGEYRTGQLRLGAELYDSRVHGGEAGTPITTNEVNTLELVQAYIGYRTPSDQAPSSAFRRAGSRSTSDRGGQPTIIATRRTATPAFAPTSA
jgi:hypothetical protein